MTFPHDLVGRALHARDGRPVGRVAAVYQYPDDLRAPAGAAAIGGGLLRRAHLVDLQDAAVVEGVLTVPHDRHTINSAPHFAPLIGDTLSERDAVKVREHYWGAAQPA
ncbi:hypothetical protein RB614_39515 [Phytohabitans sp. ZYX-F-186]|uniref:PRC-barrel domain-containing protein n=1 Tax=Phytohabitans maris TaxID=3071409 RepID=A0ABU0ZUE3_9ACTN|nr:hypothetical protein [Phytohabitans sp. ZYX-F-186]MDQ7910602.1 hypothetical protein [Phytohabitans sp. ZYX-F-186]